MAKITMEDGSTIEGSVEELAEMAIVFGMGEFSKAVGEKVADKSEEFEVGEFRVGDKVRIVAEYPGSVNETGDIGEITEVSPDDTFRVTVKGRDNSGNWQSASDLEKESSLKVGDLAVIADSAEEGCLENGDIVRITGIGGIFDFHVERLSDGKGEYFDTYELTTYVPTSKDLGVGDKVMLVIPQGEIPVGDFGAVSTGDIGTITELNPTSRRDFVANFPKQSYWVGLSSEVVVVERAEEQSKTRRFKVGDKVRVLRDYAANSANEEGDIGVITEVDEDNLPYKVTVEGRKNAGNYHDETSIELVQEGIEPGDIISTKFYGILEVYGVNEYDYQEVKVRINGRDDALERNACTLVVKKSDRRDV